MRNTFKLQLAICLLLIPSIAYNQLNELDVLQSLSDDVSVQKSSMTNIPNDEIIEDEPRQNKKKEVISFEDKEYSYSGEGTFDRVPQIKSLSNSLTYFGYNYFQDAPNTFAQIKNIPIPPDYLIGPGDNIKVILFGKENKEFTLEVNRTGEVYFPEIGPIYIAGLSFSEMNNVIQEIIENQVAGTNVNITLGSLRNINIFILGAAFKPGMYTVSALSTLTNAIFASGGVQQNGSLRNIQHKRNGELISTFDFYDLLLNGNNENDTRLSSGDVIFIPSVKKTVGITGEVYRPAIYELHSEETLSDLVKYAGNLKPKADTESIEILRVNQANNGFDLFHTNPTNEKNNQELSHGDVVNIYPISENIKNAVLVRGHYGKPGFFPWKEGLRLGDIISYDDILQNTDMNYVLVRRQDQNSSKSIFIQSDLEKVLSNVKVSENILLAEKDEIVFLPKLLSESQITTKLIEDKDIPTQDQLGALDDEMLILEKEWKSVSYFRKSLANDSFSNDFEMKENSSLDNKESTRRYYEYNIFNYCDISAKKAKEIFDISNEIEKQINLAAFCRQQIIKPLLDIIQQQNDAGNEKQTMVLMGNVKFPGEYPFSQNMTFTDAISAGGGLKSGSNNAEIEITRQDQSNDRYISTLITSSMVGNTLNIPLHKMDIINVKEILSDFKVAKITGEVYFAGEYPISDGETLSSLVKRAGGVKSYASLESAVFVRENLKKDEEEMLAASKEDLQKSIILSSQSQGLRENSLENDDLNQILSLLDTDNKSLGRLVIDLSSILNGDNDDLLLEDGDALYIPPKQTTVRVVGEVYVPTVHIYNENITLQDYIQLSGGSTDFSNTNNTYIIKSDGSIISSGQMDSNGFFRSNKSNIEPGDTIVVPLNTTPINGLQAATNITQIIYQMAVAAAAVQSFQ